MTTAKRPSNRHLSGWRSAVEKSLTAGLLVGATLAAGFAAAKPAAAASVTTAAGGSCGRSAPAVDPVKLYGDEIEFQVRRNGTPVGVHTVRFERDGHRLTTRTRFEVAVDVLFITAYRYVYASTATWRDGCLLSLDAVTDDDGDESVVRVRRAGDRLALSGPNGSVAAPADTLPTEHWDADVLRRDAVINTITGRMAGVAIENIGAAQVRKTDGMSIAARHFVYSGDLHNEVWYDGDGRWIKMRFKATDGSTIDYACVKCARGGARS